MIQAHQMHLNKVNSLLYNLDRTIITFLEDTFKQSLEVIEEQTLLYNEKYTLAKFKELSYKHTPQILKKMSMNLKNANAIDNFDLETLSESNTSFSGFIDRFEDNETYDKNKNKTTQKDNLRILGLDIVFSELYEDFVNEISEELLTCYMEI